MKGQLYFCGGGSLITCLGAVTKHSNSFKFLGIKPIRVQTDGFFKSYDLINNDLINNIKWIYSLAKMNGPNSALIYIYATQLIVMRLMVTRL